MDTTETAGPSSADTKYLTVRQAAFIGVGAMVGAGIFALLGSAVALVIFTMITAAHLRIRSETGASLHDAGRWPSRPAGAVLVTFVFTTLMRTSPPRSSR